MQCVGLESLCEALSSVGEFKTFAFLDNHCYFGSGRIARRERAIWREVRFLNGNPPVGA